MSTSWGPVATDTLSRWGHRIVTADDGSRRSLLGSVAGPPRWLAGLAAGLQAAVLSLSVVVVPTVASYVATSADPSNDDVGWLRSVALGAGMWLLGHGAPLTVAGAQVTLVPLGITALALFACYAFARRSGRTGWPGWVAGVAGYVAVTVAVALASGASHPALAALGGLVVAATGTGAGLLAGPGSPALRDLTRPVWQRVHPAARAGGTAGVMAASALVVVACGVTIGWLVSSPSRVGDVVTSLGVDVIGWTTLALAQIALVPDLVAWALAFVAGPGFAVGSGTHFAPGGIVSGPLPALPLFGALPVPGSTGALTAAWPLVTVVVGGGVGWWLHRRLEPGPWWQPLVACATGAAVAGLATASLVALAGGSMGPGRMAVVGGSALLVGGAVALGTLVGALLATVPRHPEVRDAASRRWRRLRGTDDVGPHGAGLPTPDRDAGDDAAVLWDNHDDDDQRSQGHEDDHDGRSADDVVTGEIPRVQVPVGMAGDGADHVRDEVAPGPGAGRPD